jgi:RNA recognition motif-containing protein
VQDEELVMLFSDLGDPELAGAVTAVRVVRDAKSNIGKGFAFVQFRSKPAARAALALEGRALRGRPLRVTRVSQQALSRRPTKDAGGSGMASQIDVRLVSWTPGFLSQ